MNNKNTFNWTERAIKTSVKEDSLIPQIVKNPNCFLLLTSKEAKDLIFLIQKGVAKLTSFYVIVEMNKDYVCEIEKTLLGLGIKKENFHIINKPLQNITPKELNKVLDGRKIDYVYYDIYGSFTTKLIFTLTALHQSCFADKFFIANTFQVSMRGVTYINNRSSDIMYVEDSICPEDKTSDKKFSNHIKSIEKYMLSANICSLITSKSHQRVLSRKFFVYNDKDKYGDLDTMGLIASEVSITKNNKFISKSNKFIEDFMSVLKINCSHNVSIYEKFSQYFSSGKKIKVKSINSNKIKDNGKIPFYSQSFIIADISHSLITSSRALTIKEISDKTGHKMPIVRIAIEDASEINKHELPFGKVKYSIKQ